MTGALEQLPAHRHPFPRHDAVIANLEIFENATTTRVVALYRKHLEEVLADKGIHHGKLVAEIHKAGIFLKASSSAVGPRRRRAPRAYRPQEGAPLRGRLLHRPRHDDPRAGRAQHAQIARFVHRARALARHR